MAAPPPPPPRELIDDVIPNILLRLPPDEPKWLFRAALVCKPWLRTICAPAFLHRYRAFHGSPPLLGLVDIDREEPLTDRLPRFVATTQLPAFSVPIPATDTLSPWATSYSASPLDCRHGRALIRMFEYGCEYYLVSDPVFRDPVWGNRRRVPGPNEIGRMVVHAAAVFCAVAGCQHLDCHGSPFCVVLLFRNSSRTMSATIYSSRKGTWRASLGGGIQAPEAAIHDDDGNKSYGRGALIGDDIYFMLPGDAGIIIKYDWVKNHLSVVNPPPPLAAYNGQVTLMVMEDSSLGLAGIEHTSLHLWSRSSGENTEWLQCRVIDLEKMMPMANPRDGAQVVGFAEGVDVIFITTSVGLFMMSLKSERTKKIGKPNRNFSVLPYMSFYTPGGGRFLQLARSH